MISTDVTAPAPLVGLDSVEQRGRSAALRKKFDAFAFATAAVFTLAVVWVAKRNSHFLTDDFAGFFLVRTEPFLKVALTPIDVHFVPLHRIVTQLIHSIAPLDFGVALAVLALFHAAAVATLYATLRQLKDSPVNAVLVFFYATNVYLGVLFLWWTSGLHRLPYIAFAIATIFHYVKYRRGRSRRSLFFTAACFAAALGFYSKAPLIPVYLLGVEVCLIGGTPRREIARNLSVIAGLLAAGVLYAFLTRALVDSSFTELHLDVGFLLDFERRSFAILSEGVFGIVYWGLAAPVNAVLFAFWLGFIAYTIAKEPKNAVVWIAGVSVVALNVALIAVSHRTERFGLSMANTYRYYFELMFLVVIFVGMALHNLPPRTRPSRFTRNPRWKTMWVVLAGCALALLASMSFFRFDALLDTPRYRRHRQAREFVENLTAGLDELRADPSRDFAFVDGLAPRFLTGKTAAHIRRYSRFLTIFDFEARFDAAAPRLYWITETGEVRQIERPRQWP
jgi:hypothetical protein